VAIDTGIFASAAHRNEPRHPDCATLLRNHTDLGLGFVDASIVAVAERLGHDTIATPNHRDFAVVHPTHRDAFNLIP
jgi:hypothetical protein